MHRKIVLAGGCFWGLQQLFRDQPGVITTRVGYAGGSVDNPTYQNHDGHAEALEIDYDAKRTSYQALLDFFFSVHDPTTLDQQGNDIGMSYRSAIFYTSQSERRAAADFIEVVNRSGRWENPVVTRLEPLKKFYPAEAEHQDYLQKHPGGYTCHFVRFGSYLPAK